ncbi:MAG: hypothetical protein RL596_2432 [Bacteroidota bacterium]|jgi:predicted Na+-dependent transporter
MPIKMKINSNTSIIKTITTVLIVVIVLYFVKFHNYESGLGSLGFFILLSNIISALLIITLLILVFRLIGINKKITNTISDIVGISNIGLGFSFLILIIEGKPQNYVAVAFAVVIIIMGFILLFFKRGSNGNTVL